MMKRIGELKAENARLKTENSGLSAAVASLERVDNLIIARLKAECQARQAENSVLAVECDSLKAEVERLTKAGDAVALDYAERIEIEAGETAKTLMKIVPVLRDWNDAKEGKQL
jgi:cell division protein FtsB